MSGSTFDTTKTSLQDLLKNIDTGRMQLPDFQRGWVWDDERIRSLLASLAVSFPIGAVMLLETGGPDVRFKPRPVEGVQVDPALEPEILILDGQQRFTSLYQSLMLQKPVQTTTPQKKKIERYYYFNMQAMVDGDLDEETAILSIPADRQIKSDFGRRIDVDVSTPELEYQNHLFPANRVFNAPGWRTGYQKHWQYAADIMELYNEFDENVIERFKQYHLPVIQLNKSTPKEAVCLVFEKVNTGGVALNVFELLTATFAADNFQLRDDWLARENRLKSQHKPLATIQSDDFLQAIALLVTWARRRQAIEEGVAADKIPGISCKRRDILRLTLNEYRQWADAVEQGFGLAARFLVTQHIYRAVDVPYRTQIVPLAAAFVTLGKDAEPIGAQKRIARWYWCGVLGELYGGAVETRFARDLPELVEYVRNEDATPKTIQDANFDANRLLSLRTRNSAAYKGIHALLMRAGCRDFRTDHPITMQTFFGDSIDIHHIFPQKWCNDRGIDGGNFNSIINKTAIASRTNQIIGGNAPSVYLQRLRVESELNRDKQAAMLSTHGIDADLLYVDNFEQFFARRGAALVKLIEEAMGKTVAQESADFLTYNLADNSDDTHEEDDEGETWIESASDWEDPTTTDVPSEATPRLFGSVANAATNEAVSAATVINGDSTSPDNLDLEERFHQAMLDVYRTAKRELNYSATYFLQMVSELGGLEAARRLLAKSEISDGFTELYLHNRLDLTVEAQVIKPDYHSLFTADEIATATRRLEELGYPVNRSP